MTRAWKKKNLANRQRGAFERLEEVKEPDARQQKEIEILKKKLMQSLPGVKRMLGR